jgi:hypothetical protein
MKHLKTFDLINEEFDTPTEQEIYAETWNPSEVAEADYDLIWTNAEGETVSASFAASPGPIMNDAGGSATSTFDSVQGTSTDGKNYVAEAVYEETKEEGKYAIVSFIIHSI